MTSLADRIRSGVPAAYDAMTKVYADNPHVLALVDRVRTLEAMLDDEAIERREFLARHTAENARLTATLTAANQLLQAVDAWYVGHAFLSGEHHQELIARARLAQTGDDR